MQCQTDRTRKETLPARKPPTLGLPQHPFLDYACNKLGLFSESSHCGDSPTATDPLSLSLTLPPVYSPFKMKVRPSSGTSLSCPSHSACLCPDSGWVTAGSPRTPASLQPSVLASSCIKKLLLIQASTWLFSLRRRGFL